jgi:hypothetical protein
MYFRWTATLRPDLAALMLTAVALYLIARPRVNSAQIIFCGLAMGLALSVKQTFVALPFALGVWLISEKRFSDLLLVAVACVTPIGIVIGILSFRGEPVLRHLLVLGHTVSDLGVASVTETGIPRLPGERPDLDIGRHRLDGLHACPGENSAIAADLFCDFVVLGAVDHDSRRSRLELHP